MLFLFPIDRYNLYNMILTKKDMIWDRSLCCVGSYIALLRGKWVSPQPKMSQSMPTSMPSSTPSSPGLPATPRVSMKPAWDISNPHRNPLQWPRPMTSVEHATRKAAAQRQPTNNYNWNQYLSEMLRYTALKGGAHGHVARWGKSPSFIHATKTRRFWKGRPTLEKWALFNTTKIYRFKNSIS